MVSEKYLEFFKGKESFEYAVHQERSLTKKERLLIDYFYRPLLGNRAVSLYLFFISEFEFFRSLEAPKASSDRLLEFLGFERESLENELKRLKEFGLIRFIKNKNSSFSFFLFQILPPKTIKKLFSDENLYQKYLNKIKNKRQIQEIYSFFSDKNIFELFPGFNASEKKSNEAKKEDLRKLFPNYEWDSKELLQILSLQQDYDIEDDCFRLILNYVFEKNGTLKTAQNYLTKIIEDLSSRKIISSYDRVVLHFENIASPRISPAKVHSSALLKTRFPALFVE